MKKFAYILVLICLFLLGSTALICGWMLMDDPSGEMLGTPLYLLDSTPFSNFFYPGLILFLVNGCFAVMTFIACIYQSKNYTYLIIVQGILLFGWLSAEVYYEMFDLLLHTIYYSIALILIGFGIYLRKKTK